MDYEQKLKEALSDVNTPYIITTWIEEKFPELVESEDERIRKQIRELLLDAPTDELRRLDIDLKKAFNWLESVNLDFYQIREGVFSRQLVEDFRKYMEGE